MEKAELISCEKSLTKNVVQGNNLVRGKQDELTALEAKLVRLAVAQVLKNDTDMKTYTVNVTDLSGLIGVRRENIYSTIDNVTTDLMKKLIQIRKKTENGRGDYDKFHWVDSVSYTNGNITITLSEKLKPYLHDLGRMFTSYQFEEIARLPSYNSIRLYELLASFQDMKYKNYPDVTNTGEKLEKGEIAFTVQYLREYFNCENKYPNTGNFIIKVLDKSIDAIRDHTMMGISYRLIKKKGAITNIVFKTGSELWTLGQRIAISEDMQRRGVMPQGEIIGAIPSSDPQI